MATGVSGYEILSENSSNAARPHDHLQPLPAASDVPVWSYPNRLPEADVISSTESSFSEINRHGHAAPVRQIEANSLVLADNLVGLHNILESGHKATLIYLDPPYNTGMEFQSRQLEHAYSDQFGLAAYVEYMRRRLILMREILSDDGSIYVHIGFQMVAHLKILMDEIFGQQNFRNIITRRKCSSKNFTKHQYANLNDFVLFYTKTDNYKWNQPGEKPGDDWIDKEYNKKDERGKYKLVPIHAPGTRRGATGEPWRGMLPPPGKHWQYVPEKLEAIDRAGEMHWSKNGNPRRKVYLSAEKLVPYTDYWDGFRDAHHQSIAVSGYPTEKNLDMLRMIVSASSDVGDLVIDPFCGSGTTLHAANDQGRQWIGIDQSFHALRTSITRFRHGLKPMGDFVSRGRSNASESVEPDLFEASAAACAPTESRESTTTAADFSFLVDDGLIAEFLPEITEIGSI